MIGELSCGTVKNRPVFFAEIQDLAQAPVASDAEVLEFIEIRLLMGRGIGYIDMHLLASTVLAGAALWTRDLRVATVAAELNVRFPQQR